MLYICFSTSINSINHFSFRFWIYRRLSLTFTAIKLCSNYITH
nr:MAG TPA: hypothetical protein [Bacteriophage sp.]